MLSMGRRLLVRRDRAGGVDDQKEIPLLGAATYLLRVRLRLRGGAGVAAGTFEITPSDCRYTIYKKGLS